MEQFTNCIVEAYMSGAGGGSVNSLRQISEQFGITLMKTRKILITVGVYHTEISEQVISLWENGKNISEIMQETGLSRSSVHSYLPYTKMIYNADELSLYAERCRLYRKRKQEIEKLHYCMDKSLELLENHLWETLKCKRQTMRLTLNETPLFYERRGFRHSSGSSSAQGIS